MNAIEEAIRRRAYKLWDHASRPDGRSDEFWFAARAEFEREQGTREEKLGAPASRRVEPPRHETAADWGKRQPTSRL
jgi:hypothetical protein